MSKPLSEEMEDLRKAWLDLWYLIFKTAGIIRLAKQMGMKPRSWVQEREP